MVRLPFIALFALSTWLMARLTTRLFDAPWAGFFAALLLNLSPLFGVVFGSFVLPDGPLDAALLAAALCLTYALDADERGLGWWAGVGLAAGLALFSKYSAILVIGGAFLYLVTTPRDRRLLARPGPWLAVFVALLVFAPVLAWNTAHHWISFGFQGDRAFGFAFHPFAPFVVFGGEALYLLPWIWLPLVWCGIAAFRRGPEDRRSWLLLCLAAPAVLLFSVIAIWARGRVLFHWAAPGYLMLFPLAGVAIASSWEQHARALRRALGGTGAFVVAAALLLGLQVRFGLVPFPIDHDPTLQMADWTSLAHDLRGRGLLRAPVGAVAAVRWSDAAKIDYALGGRLPVIVLGGAPHEYGLIHPVQRYRGRTVLVLAPNVGPQRMQAEYGHYFTHIEALPPVIVTHAGRPALRVPAYFGEKLK